MPDPTPAVLFDIDGTLVDSNYLHVEAWTLACADVGAPVDAWRVHRAIGMDSAKLLDAVLGDRASELGDAAKQAHQERYRACFDRLRPLPGARDLLATVAGRSLQVVLATSAPQEELEALRATLEVESWLSAVTSAEDVETAKPEPDVVQVALERAGVPASRAVMVGDTVWDGDAAGKAGVRFVGVRSGGISAAELRDAGAVAVYDDPADLLAHLADSPLAELLDS